MSDSNGIVTILYRGEWHRVRPFDCRLVDGTGSAQVWTVFAMVRGHKDVFSFAVCEIDKWIEGCLDDDELIDKIARPAAVSTSHLQIASKLERSRAALRSIWMEVTKDHKKRSFRKIAEEVKAALGIVDG